MKRYTQTTTEVNRLVHDVNTMEPEELHTIHGIRKDGNGNIYDIGLDQHFSSAIEWANAIIDEAQEFEDIYSKMGGNSYWDDEY